MYYHIIDASGKTLKQVQSFSHFERCVDEVIEDVRIRFQNSSRERAENVYLNTFVVIENEEFSDVRTHFNQTRYETSIKQTKWKKRKCKIHAMKSAAWRMAVALGADVIDETDLISKAKFEAEKRSNKIESLLRSQNQTEMQLAAYNKLKFDNNKLKKLMPTLIQNNKCLLDHQQTINALFDKDSRTKLLVGHKPIDASQFKWIAFRTDSIKIMDDDVNKNDDVDNGKVELKIIKKCQGKIRIKIKEQVLQITADGYFKEFVYIDYQSFCKDKTSDKSFCKDKKVSEKYSIMD